MKPVTQQSAADLLRLLRTSKISPVELADDYIGQIERLNPKINALVDFDAQCVRDSVRKAEKSALSRGPLFGLPVTIKSSISTAGHRCEIGSLINRGSIPSTDAVAVERLRRAGAIILGTTNAPEFLMAYETDNLLHGRTNNPWNLDYTPGGSSGGESAAIAAGMSAAGLGSDSGGSVRVPAHFTGICSLKPTPGRVPGIGHLPACVGPFSILGAIGPMARTMEDVALLFEILAGQDRHDPVSPPVPLRKLSLEDLKRQAIGYFEDEGLGPVTAETRQAVRDAARALRRTGFNVRPFRPKALELARKLWWKFFVQCGAMFYRSTIQGHEEKLSPIFKEFLSIAAAVPALSAEELLGAWAECDVIRGKLLREMDEFPIWLTPVCSIPAFRHGERKWVVEDREVEYLDVMRYTQWFNLLAAPAAVLPISKSPEGLPIGVQIAGRPFEDEVVLGIARTLDAEFGYAPPPMSM